MHGRIIHVYPFGYGGGVELLVGRDERQPAQAGGWACLVQIGCRRQLHSVIGPQAIDFRQPFSVGQQGGRDFQDGVLVSGVMPELGKEGGNGGSGQEPAAASTSNGGSDLDTRNPREKNLLSGSRIGQSPDPTASDLVEVTLDDCAGVEDESGHVSAVRG